MSEPPECCPKCGNADIEVKRDTGIYEWNWTCYDCMSGDYQFSL